MIENLTSYSTSYHSLKTSPKQSWKSRINNRAAPSGGCPNNYPRLHFFSVPLPYHSSSKPVRPKTVYDRSSAIHNRRHVAACGRNLNIVWVTQDYQRLSYRVFVVQMKTFCSEYKTRSKINLLALFSCFCSISSVIKLTLFLHRSFLMSLYYPSYSFTVISPSITWWLVIDLQSSRYALA